MGRVNRNYYPYYIYKILDQLLAADDYENRRVLYYIYIQSKETVEADDADWEQICLELAEIDYVPTDRTKALEYRLQKSRCAHRGFSLKGVTIGLCRKPMEPTGKVNIIRFKTTVELIIEEVDAAAPMVVLGEVGPAELPRAVPVGSRGDDVSLVNAPGAVAINIDEHKSQLG